MTNESARPTDSEVECGVPYSGLRTPLLRRLPWLRFAAEFGVIFLGVSLGLLADDWRQSRDEREEEVRALSGLLSDLEADASDLARVGQAMQVDDASAMWIRQRLGRPDIPTDSAAHRVIAIFNYQSYQPPRATYSGLRSTGRLVLIRDDELRLKITDYYEERQPRLVEYFDSYYEFWVPLRKALSADWVITFPSDRQRYGLRGAGLSFQPPAWDQFPSDPNAVYYLDEVGILSSVIAGRTETLLAENAEIQDLIRGYLDE